MKAGKAFLAGVVGGAAMSAVMFLAREVMGMNVKLELMLGTMLMSPGLQAWIVGLLMHLMISGLIALAYAWAFENVTHKAGVATGALVSIVHILIAGIFMGAILPAMHPLVPEQMGGPGYFMANLGAMGIMAFVMLHLMFGAIVGAMYGPVLHSSANPTPVAE